MHVDCLGQHKGLPLVQPVFSNHHLERPGLGCIQNSVLGLPTRVELIASRLALGAHCGGFDVRLWQLAVRVHKCSVQLLRHLGSQVDKYGHTVRHQASVLTHEIAVVDRGRGVHRVCQRQPPSRDQHEFGSGLGVDRGNLCRSFNAVAVPRFACLAALVEENVRLLGGHRGGPDGVNVVIVVAVPLRVVLRVGIRKVMATKRPTAVRNQGTQVVRAGGRHGARLSVQVRREIEPT
mmetsp:Transcript_28801/g.75572  ORF Transcript_28801/g.75572 Transcript_28801/m.75572 type:complete len:235 (+) Transcript_28801:366-1070(+)